MAQRSRESLTSSSLPEEFRCPLRTMSLPDCKPNTPPMINYVRILLREIKDGKGLTFVEVFGAMAVLDTCECCSNFSNCCTTRSREKRSAWNKTRRL